MYKTAKSNPHEQRELRQELRNHATSAEAVLWGYLKGSQVGGYKFRRQHGMGPYVMDFYCPSLRLCIELDGEVHNGYLENQRDEIRTQFLQENGIAVLRYENKQVWQNVEGIIKEILEFAERRNHSCPKEENKNFFSAIDNEPIDTTTPTPPSRRRGIKDGNSLPKRGE